MSAHLAGHGACNEAQLIEDSATDASKTVASCSDLITGEEEAPTAAKSCAEHMLVEQRRVV